MPCVAAALVAAGAHAGTFSSDFSNPSVGGISLVGGARANGDPYPAIANGVLALTYAEPSLNGSAFLDELDPGQAVGSFNLDFKLRIGGGTSDPADGFSIYFGPDLGGAVFGEEGPEGGTGLVITFDTFDNGAGEAPAIDVKYGGAVIGHVRFTAGNIQSDTFSNVSIKLKSNGTLDLTYKGAVVYSNLYIPGFTPASGKFAFGARTGAAFSNHWIDDLSISTTVAGAPTVPTVATGPASQSVPEHADVTFTALPGGTPPFTIEWLKDGATIPGATELTYTLTDVPSTLNGARYSVKITNAQGTVTSDPAVLTVAADVVPPALTSVRGSETFTTATVVFSEAVNAATAGVAGNYSIAGLPVTAATVLSPTTVRLTTAPQTPGARYTLVVNNITDKASVANSIAAGSSREFGAWVLAKGFLKFESYLSITGVGVQALLDDPKFQAGTPDAVGFVSAFDSRSFYPTDATENYGARISGFFTPDVSGDYRFFSRSDDASQTFLSPDTNPGNATQIAEETGCCNGFLESPAAQTSEPQPLVGGTRYFVQMLYKEGGGGDYGQVAVRREGDPTPSGSLTPIPGRMLSTFADPDAASITISSSPVSLTGSENTHVTFTAAGTGTPAPVVLQWQRAEAGSETYVDIAGATGTSYTTPILKQATDNGAKYRVEVRVPGKTQSSGVATLTVIIDSTPPSIVSAVAGDNLKSLTLTYSEAMLTAGLGTPANYTVPGVTVSSATVINSTTVRLTTTAMPEGGSLTVQAASVRDSAGNVIVAPGNSASFRAPVIVLGAATFEAYTGFGGVQPADLRANAKFPGSPDVVRLLPGLEMNGFGDNYGGRIKAFFIPPVTGDYVAYLAADDGGELYLSTDDSEVNKRLVAVEPVWANSREWVTVDSADRRPDTAKIDANQPAPNVSVPVQLVGGQRYYTEIQYKEGGGGDHGAAKFVLASDGAPENGTLPAFGPVLATAVDPARLAELSLPVASKSAPGSGTAPGFRIRVNQANQIGDVGLPTYIYRAEQQLAGLVDTNSADLTLAVGGVFNRTGIINFNQDAGSGTDIGNFRLDSAPPFTDEQFLGIPGLGKESTRTDNIAAEVITYVEFPRAGVYFMGVNSDDGFSVTATDQAPVDNLGVYATSGGVTKGFFAAHGGTDKGGVFRPITAPIVGKAVLAVPPLADSPIVNVDQIRGNIAVIDRGVNTFSAKAQFAKDAGAIGVIIVNSRDPDSANGKFPIVMGGAVVDQPAVMISKPQGAELKAMIAAGETTIRIAPDSTRYLGSFDGGRGASDTVFAFNVAEAGLYPLRLVWFEGGGGANLEWFTVNPDGTKIPVNDTSNASGLRAFQTRTFVPPTNPEVSATLDGSDIVLTFKGTLQSSATIDGTYTDVVSTSPHRIPAGSSSGNRFYRARN